jgi:hypothetical protein
LHSFNFTYSGNKIIEHRLEHASRPDKLLKRLNFEKRRLTSTTQYYKNVNQSLHLCGLAFTFEDGTPKNILFGSSDDKTSVIDSLSNHVFGYARGRKDQYLNGFQFVYYKICPVNNTVESCKVVRPYAIPENSIYRDNNDKKGIL